MCDDSNTQYLHPSNDEEELDINNYIAPPKTPDYRPIEDDDEMLNTDGENDSENSPPPSQPRPTQSPPKGHRETRLLTSNKPSSPPKHNLPKRGQKRTYMDHKTVENKIAKTENSIRLLEEHLTNRTCPKSLRYTAKPNITPDNIFEKELKDIKLDAEQNLVDALTRFHKRKLDGQRQKLRAFSQPHARRNKHVKRQPFNETQSANRIVNHNNVNLADLQKQISDLKEIVCSHVFKNSANKQDKHYHNVFSDSEKAGHKTSKGISKNKRRKNRRNTSGKRRAAKERELNGKFLKNLSTHQLSDDQVNVLSRGLKFIPTPVTNKTIIRRQLLQDFKQFARRMRLQYIFHGQDKEPHPFHVKSNWMPPVQQSVTLESYLESVKTQLADIRINTPKNNLSRNEMAALKELKNNSAINLKKADKGTTTVIMNKSNKIREAEVQLENREHYKPLGEPLVKTTQTKVNKIIDELHRGKHIDVMTKKWLSQTTSPPRIPVFYTLTKIHKPIMVGRPIISGCDGPTERISSFVDTLLQPIAQKQQSYIKDTTDFINFIEKTKIGEDTILVTMDVSSLYTNIPQEEGTEIVCKAYEMFHNYDPPIPTHYLRDMLGLILTENSFEFNGKNYLQTHGVAMGTKTAVSFANIFMAEIETNLIQQNNTKPREWKRYIDDVFSLWDCTRNEVDRFIQQANTFHPTIKFTAEISENEITFLDTVVFKGERFIAKSILDIKTHYKPTETFQYTHFTSCHPPGVKKRLYQRRSNTTA